MEVTGVGVEPLEADESDWEGEEVCAVAAGFVVAALVGVSTLGFAVSTESDFGCGFGFGAGLEVTLILSNFKVIVGDATIGAWSELAIISKKLIDFV